MLARLATDLTILRISIQEKLIYRGDFLLATTMRFLPIVTQVFLWGAVFAAVGNGNPQKGEIVGYRYGEVIAYYLLVMISRAFSSMPGLASGIARDIRDGTIKKYLIQPIDMLEFLLLYRIAHKLVYYTVAFVPFAIVFYLCQDFFPGWPPPEIFAAYVVSLVLAFLLGFFLEATIGMLGFWFLEVSSLLFVYMLINYFCSGHMFPLDMLPKTWATVLRHLPLQYLAYFPAAVFLGKLSPQEVAHGLAIQAVWVVFFFCLARITLHLGLRRYSGFGG